MGTPSRNPNGAVMGVERNHSLRLRIGGGGVLTKSWRGRVGTLGNRCVFGGKGLFFPPNVPLSFLEEGRM